MGVIKVENLVKSFKIPRQHRGSIREHAFNLFKRQEYEVFDALGKMSFEVKKGEFFGVIGANGSGKSTLLKMMAGVYSPSMGQVKVQGRIAPFLELGVGFNPEMSGRENVYLNGAILGLSDKEIREKYDGIVEFAELERFMEQKLKNFSSGMYARLAFSIAMESEADVYLLDEVLAVGDKSFQVKCFDKFRELKRIGKTVVFVSHDLHTVKDFCDRVLFLKNGEMVKLGKPEEVIKIYS